jgi:hypothetical protein
MMNFLLIKLFIFVLILIGVMAGTTFMISQRQGLCFGNVLLESSVWGVSLVACAEGDYLLVM